LSDDLPDNLRPAADFSRIRRANLGRFTIDRLMTILAGLGQEVEVTVRVHPR
jgi:predicted XRE-type DNA-binding protein